MSATSATNAVTSPLPASHGPARDRTAMSRGAFWVMTQRIMLCAAAVDLVYFALFLVLGAPWVAWPQLISVAVYIAAYGLLKRRVNRLAIGLAWLEVIVHSAAGTLLYGWDSGMHYFLFMFAPTIALGSSRRVALRLGALALAYLLGLDWLGHGRAPWIDIASPALDVLRWLNTFMVFTMFFATARFYRGTVARAERKLEELATLDPLTGLANRRHLLVAAAREAARAARSAEPLAVMLADLDHFKLVNDTLGHEAGDKVLVATAGLLRSVSRAQDVLCRWGGEEFLILLPGTDLAGGAQCAERVRAAAAGSAVMSTDRAVRVTLSIGVTLARAGEGFEETVARADRALYESKRAGRNAVTCLA